MSERAPITVIDLWPHEFECHVCGADGCAPSSGPSYGIPIYEGEILPDDDPGEWGGVPVCPRCYFMVVGYQSQHAGRVPLHWMRRLAKGGDTA